MTDYLMEHRSAYIAVILNLDQRLQQLLRAGWPNSWLQLNLPVECVRALLALESSNVNTPGGLPIGSI